MSMIRHFPMLAVLAVAAPAVHAQYASYPGYGGYQQGQGGVVRCESMKGRTSQCQIDTRYGIRLARQLSDSACDEGRTWGVNRYGVWVSGGCRGDFVMGDGGYGNGYGNGGYGNGNSNGQRFTCESRNGRQNFCSINGGGRVRVYRQLSDSACDEGRTWGQDQRGVWVAGGCRAEFIVTGYGRNYGWRGRDDDDDQGRWNGGGYGYGGQAFRCESTDGRQNFCNVDTRGGVRLVRRLSNNACDEGRTWGATRGGVWVSQGCRAEFVAGR